LELTAASPCGILAGVETRQEPTRSVDVTGLSEEAIRAVESLVVSLREQHGPPRSRYRSHEDWSKAFHDWVNSHRKLDRIADDSRESIYAGRGE
jgi:hypothetical protein